MPLPERMKREKTHTRSHKGLSQKSKRALNKSRDKPGFAFLGGTNGRGNLRDESRAQACLPQHDKSMPAGAGHTDEEILREQDAGLPAATDARPEHARRSGTYRRGEPAVVV